MVSLDAKNRQQQAQKQALDTAEQLRQRNVQAFGEMSESRQRRRNAPCFHLPDVLTLKVDDALRARSELGHGEPFPLAELADPFSHFAEEAGLTGNVRIHPRRHTNSTISPSASSP